LVSHGRDPEPEPVALLRDTGPEYHVAESLPSHEELEPRERGQAADSEATPHQDPTEEHQGEEQVVEFHTPPQESRASSVPADFQSPINLETTIKSFALTPEQSSTPRRTLTPQGTTSEIREVAENLSGESMPRQNLTQILEEARETRRNSSGSSNQVRVGSDRRNELAKVGGNEETEMTAEAPAENLATPKRPILRPASYQGPSRKLRSRGEIRKPVRFQE